MLRIDNLKLPVGAKEDKLRAACAHALRVSEEALVSVHLLRRSIDAREGVKLVCSWRGRGQKRIQRFTALQE